MEPTSPVLPSGAELEQVFAASDGSGKYSDLPTFRTDKSIVSRWKLSDEERAYIAAGGDLFICILNFGQPIWPILPIAAPPDEALDIVLKVEETV